MKTEKVVIGKLDENCYLLSDEQVAVVIDPGKLIPRIKQFAAENAAKEFYILLTHCHFDHSFAAGELRTLTGGKIVAGKKAPECLLDPVVTLSDRFHAHMDALVPDIVLSDGETLLVGTMSFTLIETPGHTEDSVCYREGNQLFSGDTLFCGNIGRTDFPGGDGAQMVASLKKLALISENLTVFPGHGLATSLDIEKKNNPLMKLEKTV